MKNNSLGACIAAILPILLISACGTSPREYFYTLNPVALPAAADSVPSTPLYRVSVGPVSVPEIVDRPQFVIRQSPNRVDLLEQHRWAQSLRTEIARVMAADIGSRLSEAQVTRYTDYASRNADYRILIDIERFDAVAGEGVAVQAVWTVRQTAGGASQSGHALIRERVTASGIEAFTAAYGHALAAICGEIADSVQSLRADSAAR